MLDITLTIDHGNGNKLTAEIKANYTMTNAELKSRLREREIILLDRLSEQFIKYTPETGSIYKSIAEVRYLNDIERAFDKLKDLC